MREDLGTVVIERPRRNSSAPTLKARDAVSIVTDDASWEEWDHEGSTRIPSNGPRMQAINKKLGDKDFSDVLGPIEGILRKNLGRPWDKIWSEFCKVLSSTSHGIYHIRTQHIDVERNTWIDETDGKVYYQPKYGHYAECISESTSSYRLQFYVHPKTGCLCRAKYIPVKKRKATLPKYQIRDGSIPEKWIVFDGGTWYIGHYQDKPKSDMMLNSYMNIPMKLRAALDRKSEFPNTNDQMFVRDKSASKKEIRKYVK